MSMAHILWTIAMKPTLDGTTGSEPTAWVSPTGHLTGPLRLSENMRSGSMNENSNTITCMNGLPTREGLSGRKDDSGKTLFVKAVLASFPKALEAVAEVSQYGANKYSWFNWKKVENAEDRYSEAMVRHFMHELGGKKIDEESGFNHAIHVAWNALARLELILDGRTEQTNRERETEDATPEPSCEGPSNTEVQTTCRCGKTVSA